MTMYRLRSIQRLLEKGELERQEIYFADTDELNDPIDGFKNIVFYGDRIVWKNFFKHFLKNVFLCVPVYCAYKEKTTRDDILKAMAIKNPISEFCSVANPQFFNSIWETFLQDFGPVIDKIAMIQEPITRDELINYLYNAYVVAWRVIMAYPCNHHSDHHTMTNELLKLIDFYHKNKMKIEQEIPDFMCYAYAISNAFNNRMIGDFAPIYMEQLEQMLFPRHYVACFTEAIDSMSLWGHYGDSHRGVGLIFETQGNSLSLTDVDNRKHNGTFRQVLYGEEFQQINFFESFWQVPGLTIMEWGRDSETDEISEMMNKIITVNDDDRKRYWNNFYKSSCLKTKDWAYEKEYRLIVDSFMDVSIEKNKRCYKYAFKDLKGIVFGLKTLQSDQDQIRTIIKQKCKEEQRDIKDFDFYQAHFHQERKAIVLVPLLKV